MAEAAKSDKPKGRWKKITRRAFLIGGVTTAGGLAVGVGLLSRAGTGIPEHFAKAGADGAVALNAWVRIEPDGTIALAVPRAEMGQGVYTGLAMLIAEELEVDLDRVTVEHPDMHGVYTNYALPMEGAGLFHAENNPLRWVMAKVLASVPYIGTGGSTSVIDAWTPLRQTGAAARTVLIEAAAKEWGVDAADCQAAGGKVMHPDGKTMLAYAAVARAAADLTPPSDPELKPASRFRLVGTPQPRVDMVEKATGAATFGVDVSEPNMLYAAVRHSPVKGGRIVGYDAAAVRDMRGVEGVVEVPGGVAVVADNTWRAFKAAEALPIEVDAAGNGDVSTIAIAQDLQTSLDEEPSHVFEAVGDVDAGFDGAAKVVDAEYSVPYLAHACMEPMNATVRLNADNTADVWAPTQSPTVAVWATADGTGVERDAVRSHTTYLGGGFGRRAENDFVLQAAHVAKAFPGRAVKLTWSREEDIRNDTYRPAAHARFKGALDAQGALVGWDGQLASQSVEFEFGERVLPWGGGDGSSTFMNAAGAFQQPYAMPHCRIGHRWRRHSVPVGFWRSVGHSQNAFFLESFVDEMAHAAGKDPYAFRRGLLNDKPRHRAVLDAVAKAADWGGEVPDGRGRGIALHESFGSIVAQVAEVAVVDGEIRVERVWCAVDCGVVVNPDTIDAQMQSGVIYGLSAALYGAITVADGRIEQGNFPDYEMIRLDTAPKIETVLVPNGDRPGGIGEVALPPIAPAVANAVFAAIGQRLRRLPFTLEA